MSNQDIPTLYTKDHKRKNKLHCKILNRNKLSYVHFNIMNTQIHTYKQIHMYKLFGNYTMDKNLTLWKSIFP